MNKPNLTGLGKQQLNEGKERMKRKCIEVALLHTPSQVHTIEIRKSLSGSACHDGKMAVPRPFTRKGLYIFLHECAHFHLGHCSKCSKPKHLREFEAERWAHDKMREAGIAVPKSMTMRAKEYVAWKIEQAKRRGAKHINAEAQMFAAMKRRDKNIAKRVHDWRSQNG